MENTKVKTEDRLTVRNVPAKMKQQIEAIASNEGMTISSWTKNQLRNVINTYPENMKQKD